MLSRVYVTIDAWLNLVEPQVLFMDDGQPRFVCPQCGVKYKKVSGLRGHMKECGRGAQCPICPKIVTQRRNLRKHMEKHQRDAVGVISIKDVVAKATLMKPWKFLTYDKQESL